MNVKEALEHIKNAPTIYCGCGSDVYTRYPIEIKKIERYVDAMMQICTLYDEYYVHQINGKVFADMVGVILMGAGRPEK